MQIKTNGIAFSTLLELYNLEIDKLKSKLLSGVPWEELATTRKNITEPAIAIHRHHDNAKSATKEQNEDRVKTGAQ